MIGHGDRLDFHVSTQAGVVRQADRHITTDPPTPDELEAVARGRPRRSSTGPSRATYRSHPGRALGVAGTPTSLAAIAQDLDPYDPERVHGYVLTASERDEIFERLAAMPLEQRRTSRAFTPTARSRSCPGIVILTEIMNLFELDAIEVSEHDILRGAALHYSRTERVPVPGASGPTGTAEAPSGAGSAEAAGDVRALEADRLRDQPDAHQHRECLAAEAVAEDRLEPGGRDEQHEHDVGEPCGRRGSGRTAAPATPSPCPSPARSAWAGPGT